MLNLPNILSEADIKKFKKRILSKRIKHYLLIQPQIKYKKIVNQVDGARVLPKNVYTSPLVIWIFGNVVAHVLWEKNYIIFIIKNKKVAQSYRGYFNTLWKISKPIS